MNANSKNLDAIFNMTRQLVVPLFQRPYVWNEEDNWAPLWESVREVAERLLETPEVRPHFLGAIVVDQVPKPLGDVECRQVIDGQQRLTTLQLLLAAVRDLATELEATDYAAAFGTLTRNRVPGSENEQDEYKVWPTNHDRQAFVATMGAGSPQDVKRGFNRQANANRTGNLIADAYLYFREMLDEWVVTDGGGSPLERLKALYKALTGKLILVVIDLDDQDDAQLIFETLNFLGQPLLPADLVKNYLFHHASRQREDIEAIYRRHWAAFDEDGAFWREKVTQGRLTRPRLDLFLQHYLTRRRQKVIGATHLFAEFKDFFRDAPEDPVAHIATLREYADVFRSVMTLGGESPEARFLARLRVLDTAMVYPLLLEVFRRDFSDDHRRQILADLESYLVRRQLGVLTTKAYNRLYVDLVRRC